MTDEKKCRVALAVPWCPWIPERVKSMERLRAALQLVPDLSDPTDLGNWWLCGYREFTDKAPNDQWSEAVFEWLAEQDVEWCLQLQEDALVPENFWPVLRAILEALPADAGIVGLQVAHPIAPALAKEDVRMFTTADALVGVGYAVRREVLVEFLEWRRTKLRDGWRVPVPPKGLPSLTEDTMIGLFAMATGRRIYHPIPAIVDHDISMRSVWGNDDHVNRTSSVTWRHAEKYAHAWDATDLEGPGFWQGRFKRMMHRAPDGSPLGLQRAYTLDPAVIAGGARIPHVGRFYEATPHMARQWVVDFDEGKFLAAMQDRGDKEKRRLVYARRAAASYESRGRVLVCTPTRGGTDPRYTTSMLQLAQLFDVDFEHGLELLDSWLWHDDVVRVRSRFVRAFLETDATHLHFRDADNPASPTALFGMMKADRPFVACPYPRRDAIDFPAMVKAVRENDPRPLEAHAYNYAVEFLPGTEAIAVDAFGCMPVAGLPLGCSLLRRDMLESMVNHYRVLEGLRVPGDLGQICHRAMEKLDRRELQELTLDLRDEVQRWRAGHMGLPFNDLHEGRVHKTVALFQLLVREEILRSEDASFCARWRDMGGEVAMYLGPGSPVDHAGEHYYRGQLDAFGLRRATKDEAKALAAADTDRAAAPTP